jgi:hypothetical protein
MSTVAYGTITYFLCGFRLDNSGVHYFYFLCVLILTNFAGTAYAGLCAVVCEKQASAVMMAASGFSLFSVMSGFFLRVAYSSVIWRWLFYVSPMRSLWEGLVINQLMDKTLECPPEARAQLECFYTSGNETIESIGFVTTQLYAALYSFCFLMVTNACTCGCAGPGRWVAWL